MIVPHFLPNDIGKRVERLALHAGQAERILIQDAAFTCRSDDLGGETPTKPDALCRVKVAARFILSRLLFSFLPIGSVLFVELKERCFGDQTQIVGSSWRARTVPIAGT